MILDLVLKTQDWIWIAKNDSSLISIVSYFAFQNKRIKQIN